MALTGAARVAASLFAVLALLAAAGCASLGAPARAQAEAIAVAAQSHALDCAAAEACAAPSPLHALAARAAAESSPDRPRHLLRLLDDGPEALAARIALVRSARRSIDLQTYIFAEDDSGWLLLQELAAAARRGVQVRVLVDQLSAFAQVRTLAALASLHANFALRLYNPVLDRARLSLPMYAVASACCWRQLNRRMHNKLLLVDDALAITGGRNVQDVYFDWGEDYNFRDRDLLLAGPETAAMARNFQAFWDSPYSVPAARLGDVAGYLRAHGAPALAPPPYRRPQRVQALQAEAGDPQWQQAHLVDPALAVGPVRFIADGPRKHRAEVDPRQAPEPAGAALRALVAGAQSEILLQTPYLVLSQQAQHVFRQLHRQPAPPRVQISTNSLAATDAFIAYALSYKYKRRYLRDFGFEIHEFKPFPAAAPLRLDALGVDLPDAPPAPATPAPRGLQARRLAAHRLREAPESESARWGIFPSGGLPVRLREAGLRMGLHAKSLVVDGRVGVVGSHNFDPRGDHWNTESAVLVADPAFAAALAASIRRDMAPENAWTIGRRDPSPLLPGLEFTLARLSERMPLFDLWPVKYATSYQFVPGPDCPAPPSPFAPDFRRCHVPVGDFPEVDMGVKWLGVRLFTAFGAGLRPIL
ncbi:phospholipase D-like domain-containing protein [Thermomonas flagellata]|uniref:phospholipase D-like domain-containing protein n=1 Tax=Thermomonas flagellata TaxID=2888524 RepID=UPI001F04442C